MTFSEFIKHWNSTHHRCIDMNDSCDIDSILEEYNAYLQEEQNKPVTSEFLLGLGFEVEYEFYSKGKENLSLNISFSENYASISNEYFENEMPFPKTQKDVTDLMRLLDID